jgi:hypothetical protein
MDRYKLRDAEQSSRVEDPHLVEDPVRRQAEIFKKFKNDFETIVEKTAEGEFLVESTFKNGTDGKGIHQNIIKIDKGEIIGCANLTTKTNDWYLSKIIYCQLIRVLEEANKDISQFDLKKWYGCDVIDEETKSLALAILQEKDQVTVKRGSEEFNALVKAKTEKSKERLVADYPKFFLRKQVVAITLRKELGHVIDIDNEYD